jgi:hypothetical protein
LAQKKSIAALCADLIIYGLSEASLSDEYVAVACLHGCDLMTERTQPGPPRAKSDSYGNASVPESQ